MTSMQFINFSNVYTDYWLCNDFYVDYVMDWTYGNVIN